MSEQLKEHPMHGGSYVRDKDTGKLTRVDDSAAPAVVPGTEAPAPDAKPARKPKDK